MVKTSAILLACALAGLAGCATTVVTESAPNANMSGYHSFSWMEQTPPAGMSPVLFDRIRATIDRDLQARGFVHGASPDFNVAIDMISATWWDYDYYGNSNWYFGWGIVPNTYSDGSLMINVYDAHTKQPVWHGKGTNGVSSKVSQSEVEQIVGPIIAQFPAGLPRPIASR
jgi:hypothetical protein